MDAIKHCGDWLPIDTAPRDGQKISIWTHRNEYEPWVYWNAETGQWKSEFIAWQGMPMHWMPMPVKPQPVTKASVLPHYVHLMIASLIQVHDKTGKGSLEEFDRDSLVARLWSDSDYEIHHLSNRALPTEVTPFEDDRFPRFANQGANDA